MSALEPIRFDPHGPAAGLVEWEKIDPSTLASGEPVQRGHDYFLDDTGQLRAGVWDCTPMTDRLAPCAVNEFMHVLEGSVTIVDAAGREETMRAGESFLMPKGMPCYWKQTEYLRKCFFIFDDASGETAADPSSLRVVRLDPGCELPPFELPDLSRYTSEIPTQHLYEAYRDPTGQMQVGIWTSTPFTIRPRPYECNELMHMLEGTVTINSGEGTSHTFTADDTFLVPKGMTYQWSSQVPVRKILCIFEPREAAAVAAE